MEDIDNDVQFVANSNKSTSPQNIFPTELPERECFCFLLNKKLARDVFVFCCFVVVVVVVVVGGAAAAATNQMRAGIEQPTSKTETAT